MRWPCQFEFLRTTCTALVLAALVSACDVGQSTGQNENEAKTTPDVETASGASNLSVSGVVGDGLVVGAKVTILSNAGAVLAETESDNYARYSASVDASQDEFPLLIEAQGGVDLVTSLEPNYQLHGALAIGVDNAVANLNIFSTIAVETATSMAGGLTADNLAQAIAVVFDVLNSGASTGGNLKTEINADTGASFVRSSTALAEIVARANDSLRATGQLMSANDVIMSLASDLSDGVLDGLGGSAADTRIAALIHLSGAQTGMEAMSNRLRVNGADATLFLGAALQHAAGDALDPTLEELPATAELLRQVDAGLSAAIAAWPSVAVQSLAAAQRLVVAGMLPAEAQQYLLPSASSVLDGAMLAIAAGSQTNSDAAISAALASVSAPDASIVKSAASLSSTNGSLTSLSSEPLSTNASAKISGKPVTNIKVGKNYWFKPTVSGLNAKKLKFTIKRKPKWLEFKASNGRLKGTPKKADVGTYRNILIQVTDGKKTAKLAPFTITVKSGSSSAPPSSGGGGASISGSPKSTAKVGASYWFKPSVKGLDQKKLNFSIKRKPSWANFKSSNGRLAGTPGDNDIGTYSNIVISVSDGKKSAALAPFSISVEAKSNKKPPTSSSKGVTITGWPKTTIAAGSNYWFKPRVSGLNEKKLKFSIKKKPQWAVFKTSIGRITGTPSENDVGTYPNIVIEATDGKKFAKMGPFTITVVSSGGGSGGGGNSAPTISGQPPNSVVQDTRYDFTPTVSDADKDKLSFEVSRLPDWANFDKNKGRIWGTPDAADIGNYNNIVIKVSDGTESAELGPFSIRVDAFADGKITLNWTPPTRNTDGSKLNDLAAYRISWGPANGSFSDSIRVNNPGLSRYVVENLASGNYKFSVAAINKIGIESERSNIANASVP